MRFDDWHVRLIALIEARKSQCFAWGSNDCCLWPADAVLAMTGFDPASDLRGTYASVKEAEVILQKIGGMEGAGSRCGTEIPALCAQVGDVGLIRAESGREVGAICIGEHWLAAGRHGLGMLPLETARKAWRVA